MSKLKTFARQFNWKILLIRILVNGASLALTVLIIPDVYFAQKNFWTVTLLALVLGVLNAVVKPLFLLLTGQLIFATFGLLVFLANALILLLLERIFPTILVIDSLFWVFVAGGVLGLISNALENLLGLTPPIVPDENAELRSRIDAERAKPFAALIRGPQAVVSPGVDTQTVSEVTAARAALEVIQNPPVPPALVEKPLADAPPASLPSTLQPMTEDSKPELSAVELPPAKKQPEAKKQPSAKKQPPAKKLAEENGPVANEPAAEELPAVEELPADDEPEDPAGGGQS